MSSGGFGIAGHKNNYSNGVRCGNWIEDRIGMDLVRSGRSNPDHFETESKSHFVKPTKMDDKAVRSFPTGATEGPPLAARVGMSHHLLFGHGAEAHDPRAGVEEQFTTMTQTLFGTKPAKTTEILASHPTAAVKEALRDTRTGAGREHAKAVAREAKEVPLSETARVQARAPVAEKPAEGESKARRADFTKSWRTGTIRGLRR